MVKPFSQIFYKYPQQKNETQLNVLNVNVRQIIKMGRKYIYAQ